jgi:threonine dehydrogenase-like Zn-dependent dehydrogenase
VLFIGVIGEGEFRFSPDLIRAPRTIFGSWVTSTWLMEELVERPVRRNPHPADLVTHRFTLHRVDEACTLMASGECGKVALCSDEELGSH